MTTQNHSKSNGSASNAIPLSTENMEKEIHQLKSLNQELVAALREILKEMPYGSATTETLEAELKHWNPLTQNEAHRVQIERILSTRKAIARSESTAPAKHPDEERIDWLETNVLFNGKEHSGQVRWIFHTPERRPTKETRGKMLQFTTLRDALDRAIDAARKQEAAP